MANALAHIEAHSNTPATMMRSIALRVNLITCPAMITRISLQLLEAPATTLSLTFLEGREIRTPE